MIRRTARKIASPFRARQRAKAKARGIRPEVALPFDMFEQALSEAEGKTARKLENIYHKGQAKAWDGKQTLQTLLDRHGGIDLTPAQQEGLRGLFAVILWGELAAWKVSADLALQLEPLEAKMAATSQAHDEARHFYVMNDYLSQIGEVPKELGPRTTRVLVGTLKASTLTKKLVGMQMMIEPMALALFQLVREARIEPVLCDLLELYERDEARHVALGVLHLPRMIHGMTPAEAADLWAWEFQEFWNQVGMLKELQPHFEALGIDVRDVVRIGRAKQVRANQLLMEEMGSSLPVLEAFVRFFDAKTEWHWPEAPRADLWERARGVIRAANRGMGQVQAPLSNVAA
ncbi:MAG: ferritin-like domain-containing protein [Myxococcales bacterium]|nr:ferritin-like domain-containing protein [Myxococcales bacterium]